MDHIYLEMKRNPKRNILNCREDKKANENKTWANILTSLRQWLFASYGMNLV